MGKEKKRHKKKSKKYSSSDSSSSYEEEWVEMNQIPSTSLSQCGKPQEEVKQDKYYNGKNCIMDQAIFACISKDGTHQKSERNRDKKEEDKYMLDKLGQTSRELNPYWKDGGSGLPQEKQVATESLRQASVTVGDQGVAWLKKALQRAKEQAAEQGCSLEQVAAERWGSLEKLESMIAEAEERAMNTSGCRIQSTYKHRNFQSNSKERNDFRQSKDENIHWNKLNDKKKNVNSQNNNENYLVRTKGRHEDNKQNSINDSKIQKKASITSKGSVSDSSDYQDNCHKHSSVRMKPKDNEYSGRSREAAVRHETKYSKNSTRDDKYSRKIHSGRSYSTTSSNSDEENGTTKSREELDRRYKDDKRYSKRDNDLKPQQSKKRYDSSFSSNSAEEDSTTERREEVDRRYKYDKRFSKRDELKPKKSKKRYNSSLSSKSEEEDRTTENREDVVRHYKYTEKHSKRENDLNFKPSKKRYDRSLSSNSEDEHKSKYTNKSHFDNETNIHNEKRKKAKRTFIKPDQDSDDSFTRSNQRNSEKPKMYSSSSSKGWRKKPQSPKKEDVLSDENANPPVKEPKNREKEAPTTPAVEKPRLLTDKEMNDLGAKIVKAELFGNQELANELKEQLERARVAKANAPKESEMSEQVVILTHTDLKGFTRPVSLSESTEPTSGRRKAKKVDTHAGGKRMRYFADDDKYSLQEMFQREKFSTVEDSNAVFANLASKGVGRNGNARDMDDVFEETAQMEVTDDRKRAREKQQAIEQSKRTARSLEDCEWCLESKKMLKHLIIAMGQTCYLCVPPYQSLTDYHCLLVPSCHTPCGTQLDEDVWNEIQDFRKSIVQMFLSREEDVVFFESARYLNRFPHMVINCVPISKQAGHLEPIMYFKKAIQDCEKEWSNNKKLIELNGRDVRRAVPKGLPYFAVNFGMDKGLAHVIEDEKLFPNNFAQEIIGGILELDHTVWRKQRRQTFEEQSKKVIQLSKIWNQFDCKRRNE